jgi:general secretion pathway protein K
MQRGAAVVVAMLIAVLAAAVAAGLLWQQQWSLREHQHRREQAQAQALVFAGVQWARQVLDDDSRTVDHLGEPWAVRLPPTPVENGEIEGFISDQQALLDVNGLLARDRPVQRRVETLVRLFESVGVSPEAVDALVDWIDGDSNVTGRHGAEDDTYLHRNPPTLAANRPIVRVAELAQVQGIPLDAVRRLAPWVTALPEPAPLNVNTAPPEILRAAISGLTEDEADRVVKERSTRAFSGIDDFRTRGLAGRHSLLDEDFAVASRYFLVTVTARQGDTRARGKALLRRGTQGLPSIVWQLIE